MPRTRRIASPPEFMRLAELESRLASQGRTKSTINAYRRWLADFGVWLIQTEGDDGRPTEALAKEFLAHAATVKGYSPDTIRNMRQGLSYWSKAFVPPGWDLDDDEKPSAKTELAPDLEAFGQWLKSQNKADKTVRAYIQRVQQFQKWWTEREGTAFDLSAWAPWDMSAYQAHLKEQVSPNTLNLAIAALSQYGTWAVRAGHLPKNPVVEPGQLMVPGAMGQPKWLSRTDDGRLVRELLRRTQTDYKDAPWKRFLAVRDYAMCLAMRDAGLRISEVYNLKLENVDLEAKLIAVRFSKWNRTRQVPMTKRLTEALSQWLQIRGDLPSPYVFVSQHHDQVKERTVQTRASEWKQWVNLPDWFTAHSLRHTYGKWLSDEGTDPTKIAMLMGHLKKDGRPHLDMVAVYTQPSQVELQEAINKTGY